MYVEVALWSILFANPPLKQSYKENFEMETKSLTLTHDEIILVGV